MVNINVPDIKNKMKKMKKMKNIKNIIKKNISPKTYLKSKIYEKTKFKKKNQKKIKQEDFEIPSYGDYSKFETINYNVKQLKQICKHYKLPSSGNKTHLIFLAYNYIKLSFFSIKIQKIFRGYLRRKLNNLKGPSLFNRKCVNDCDFFTLKSLKTIPYEQFFTFKDCDHFIYGFDICSIFNYFKRLEKENKEFINPYNRKKIDENVLQKLNNIISIHKVYNDTVSTTIQKFNISISRKNKIKFKTIKVFQKMDEMGHITNPEWFLSLSLFKLCKFVYELSDIWSYRAQITLETKNKIFPNGNPFVLIPSLKFKPILLIQQKIIDFIDTFISSGVDKESKQLAVIYVLGAFTIVNQNAANSLPWLYETFHV